MIKYAAPHALPPVASDRTARPSLHPNCLDAPRTTRCVARRPLSRSAPPCFPPPISRCSSEPKPLFENISVKFGDGNRYGLIGANGCGKSTFMKILGGDLEPSGGNVMLDRGERLGKLSQDQFAYEDMRVLDVVMMGHTEMWAAMTERDAIYANPEATDDDYMQAADLEAKFAEYDGYTAEARAGELLLGAGIPIEQHQGPMSAVAPGWKLRVLLAQALFSNPDILLLDEPTNNLDINSIRWLEDVLNARNSTMIIISHDRHFLNQVCTHMADMDFGKLTVWPGTYDDYMLASTQAQGAAGEREQQGEGARGRAAGLRAALLGQQVEGPPGHQPHEDDRQDQDRGLQAVEPPEPVHPLRGREEAAPPRGRGPAPREVVRQAGHPQLRPDGRGRREDRDRRGERRGQDHAAVVHGAGGRAGPAASSSGPRTRTPASCRRTRATTSPATRR